jgi:ribonuclease R
MKKHRSSKRLQHKSSHPFKVPRKAKPALQQVVVSGTIKITSKGYGFVKPELNEEQQADIFVPPKYTMSAMSGDLVKVELLPEIPEYANDKGPAGKVVSIVRRARTALIGEVISGNKVRPLNPDLYGEIDIAGGAHGARRGEWVEVKLVDSPAHDGLRRGTVAAKLGRAGEIVNDLNAICAEYNLASPYSEEDDKAAAALVPRKIEREDFRRDFCLTIDPHDAKDFDDAISIHPGADDSEIEIGVHIADLAAYIAPGSRFDREAARRGFTAYLPGRTLPMLPKTLTAILSLTENENCLTHTVMLTVHRTSGRIIKTRRTHGIIRVAKRLNYDEVQDYIDTGKSPWNKKFTENVSTLVDITRNMRSYRFKQEKFLTLDAPEIRVLCDEANNKILGLERKLQRESSQLIEECMLAANTAVAIEMTEKNVPAIYRIHPEPFPEKLEEFTASVIEAFGLIPGDLTNRDNCNKFLKSIPDGPQKPIILSLFLRSLTRASYAEKAELHFGLGKTRYLHFTSPIRRYPDLIVHQQLWELSTKGRLKSGKDMAHVAERCTEQEFNNDEAYYAAVDRMKLRYLEEQLMSNKEVLYNGVVARIVSAGMMVDVEELGIYGFVPLENLQGNFKRYGNILKSYNGKKTFRPGDFVQMKLSAIDFARGSALFSPKKTDGNP